MAGHPGELDREFHPEGEITDALEPAHIVKFPLTKKQVQAVKERGGYVADISRGQVVEFPNGARIYHGMDGKRGGDGLHTGESSFE